MMITASRTLIGQLAAYCYSRLPEEACGALIGRTSADGDGITVTGFKPVTNRSDTPERSFAFDAEEWVKLLFEFPPVAAIGETSSRERIIGIFHSHPAAPPFPSPQDLQTDWHCLPVYWIVSLRTTGRFEMKAFRLFSTMKGAQKSKNPSALECEELSLQIISR